MKDARPSGATSPLVKIMIVAALALAAGAVLYVKKPAAPEPEIPAPATPTAAVSSETPAPPEEVSAPLPRLVDLGSNRCQSCLAMVPVLEALTKEYEGRMEVVFIDVWENPDEADRYGIQLIPTQIYFGADGSELFRNEGFSSKEDILAKWKDLGFDFGG